MIYSLVYYHYGAFSCYRYNLPIDLYATEGFIPQWRFQRAGAADDAGQPCGNIVQTGPGLTTAKIQSYSKG